MRALSLCERGSVLARQLHKSEFLRGVGMDAMLIEKLLGVLEDSVTAANDLTRAEIARAAR